MNGSAAQTSGVVFSLKMFISLPQTASRVTMFGHVRSPPVDLNDPWKFTMIRRLAAARQTRSHQSTISWSCRSRKSVFTPTAPQSASRANVSSMPTDSISIQWIQSQIPTPFAFACATIRARSNPLRGRSGTFGPWLGRRAKPYQPPSTVW